MKALQPRGDVRNFRQRLYLITYNMVLNTLRLNKNPRTDGVATTMVA